jgi:hypothetical protein
MTQKRTFDQSTLFTARILAPSGEIVRYRAAVRTDNSIQPPGPGQLASRAYVKPEPTTAIRAGRLVADHREQTSSRSQDRHARPAVVKSAVSTARGAIAGLRCRPSPEAPTVVSAWVTSVAMDDAFRAVA